MKKKPTVKKDVSTLITENRFWDIIELSEKGEKLVDVLCQLTLDEIFGYRFWWEHFVRISYTEELWAVAYVVMNGCSDDSFDYFRFWLIARGRTVFLDAMNNPDSLCDEFDFIMNPEERYLPEKELYDYAIYEALKRRGTSHEREKINYEIPYIPYPKLTLKWDAEDKESMQRVCPRTVGKWWKHEYLIDFLY